MIGRNRVKAVPQERSQLVCQRKIAKGFAVDASLFLGHLQANRAKQFAVRRLSHLKFSDAFTEIVRRKMHGLPERRKLAQIIKGRPSDGIIRRTHRAEFNFKWTNAKREIPATARKRGRGSICWPNWMRDH